MRAARRRIGAVALAFAAAWLAGCTTTPAPRVSLAAVPVEQRARAEANVRVFERVWGLVADWHYDPKLHGVEWPAAGLKYGPEAAAAVDEKALYVSLGAMVGLLKDSHTYALSPTQAKERQTQTRARTGFNMTRVDGHWIVSELLAGSPAEVAGVKTGWVVVARNGTVFGERSEARPKEGEVARWEFLDERDQPMALDIVAQSLSTKPRQEVRALPGGLVYLRFDAFDTTDRRWLSDQLKVNREAPGVVVDLRRNPGGGTISLGITIGEFFDRSVDCGTFVTRGGHRGGKNSWQIGSARYEERVVVLVDGTTGSAAEIFSQSFLNSGSRLRSCLRRSENPRLTRDSKIESSMARTRDLGLRRRVMTAESTFGLGKKTEAGSLRSSRMSQRRPVQSVMAP